MSNALATSACHHNPLENMPRKQGVTGENKKQNKRVHVALVLELEVEEKALYNTSKDFYISDLLGLV